MRYECYPGYCNNETRTVAVSICRHKGTYSRINKDLPTVKLSAFTYAMVHCSTNWKSKATQVEFESLSTPYDMSYTIVLTLSLHACISMAYEIMKASSDVRISLVR